jgi:sec-independent protein translocase protein TatA
MFGDIGIEKIFLLLLVVLLLFGAKRIPEIGSSIGRGIREFKRSINDLQNEAHASDAAPVRPSRPAPLDQPPPGAPVGPRAETRSEPKRLLT